MLKQFAWLAILAPLFCAAQEDARNQFSTRLAPTAPIDLAPLVLLNEEIAAAPIGTVFTAELRFDRPARLGDIRDIANQLQILRAVATVEAGQIIAGYPQWRARIAVGTLFNEPDSWNREICRAKMPAAIFRRSGLANTPAEEWQVSALDVLGPAEAIQQLLLGASLPPAIILQGRKQDARHMDRFAAAIKQQRDQKIQVQDSDKIADECLQFTNRILAPILTGAPAMQRAEYGDNHDPDFRAIFREHLAGLPLNMPVTMQITLRSDYTVEGFAALVENYAIDGLLAELAPQDSSIQMSSDVALSIHGGPLVEQVERYHCHLKTGNAANYDGEWLALRAQASLPAGKAWTLIEDINLVDARLLNAHKPGALSTIESYHRNLAGSKTAIPVTDKIPPGCSNYLRQMN